jgi:hypothetical protein
MQRKFILRFRGRGPVPPEDVERIRALRNTTVLDASSRMLLVEGPEAELKALVAQMPDWLLSEERMFALPDPRPKPRRGPHDTE